MVLISNSTVRKGTCLRGFFFTLLKKRSWEFTFHGHHFKQRSLPQTDCAVVGSEPSLGHYEGAGVWPLRGEVALCTPEGVLGPCSCPVTPLRRPRGSSLPHPRLSPSEAGPLTPARLLVPA